MGSLDDVNTAGFRWGGCLIAFERSPSHNRIDDAPGEITTERLDKHCTDVGLACAHTQRTGKREHHDYPAQQLEAAVEWVENPA
jgi:hypothetical protein